MLKMEHVAMAAMITSKGLGSFVKKTVAVPALIDNANR
jgi:ABC-type proline/glycine betaine transport system permease subunit